MRYLTYSKRRGLYVSLLVVLLLGFVVGCKESNKAVIECPPTINTVKTLLTQQQGKTEYYLVERVSGWHDKIVIIQLFDQKPQLGACNEDLIPPIFEDSIELDQPLIKLMADIKGGVFELVYGEPSSSAATVVLEIAD